MRGREILPFLSLPITGALGPLHAMNRVRVPLIRDALCPLHESSTTSDSKIRTDEYAPLSGIAILDVGCGGGILAEVRLFYYLY